MHVDNSFSSPDETLKMEGSSPAQLPVVQTTQAQSPPGQPVISQQQVPPGQPIMYQMQPAQQQPVFVQVPAGQPATTPDGQPIQYYYVPVTQPIQPGQQGQPVQPVQPGQPVLPGQPVYVQQVQPRQQAVQGLDLTVDKDFVKSPLCYIKIAEFVVLLGAWASILSYFDDLEDLFNITVDDEKASFFKGITIFCWVMVILYLIIYTLSFPKICNCKRPSLFTLTSLIFNFIMFALLLACTGNLVSTAVDFGKLLDQYPDKTVKKIVTALSVALAFGFLSCIAFVVDMVLNYKLFQTMRAQEMPPDQGPPQRRVWDVNTEYMRSPMFYVKLAEIALLFAAWVCIIKYFDKGILKVQTPEEDSKADFFKGITIFAWAMVVLLTLAFVLSFDKLFSRLSLWILTTLLIHFFLFVLLIACCGNLTPYAIDYGKAYKNIYKNYKPNVVALLIGLAFGFLSCIAFVVDMVLNYKLFQTQRAQEMPSDQGPPQRRVWDVNTEYMQSPMFYVKLAEIALLFAAWVCIIKYFDMDFFKSQTTEEDSKADFFKGITIFSWVMVILLALTFVLSFDRLCSRSSLWTLATLLIHFFLSVLLIACCGNMTPYAIDYGKEYKNVKKEYKPNVLALLIGLGFGYISWIIFIVDIYLLYMLYKQQRVEEVGPPQQEGQPLVVQQPAVVIVPQGAKQLVYQPAALPGQHPVQYPGQQHVLMSPPAYSQQPSQGENQNKI